MTTKEKISYEELSQKLDMFIGSMKFYPIAFTPLVFTEGVNYFAKTCECYWLIDHLGYNLYKLHRKVGALFINLKVNKKHRVHIEVKEDSEKPILYKNKIHDVCEIIPIGEYTIWLINDTLLLPNEY